MKINSKLAGVGINIGVGRVARLMNEMTLPKMSTAKPRAVKQKEDMKDIDLQNILHRNFNADAPNQKWVSDITYIKAEGRWYYLCIIMDLFARKIVAWNISSRINTQLVADTFLMAYKSRGCPSGVIFHSDRGSQYTSKKFRILLDKVNFTASYSKRGYPYDNAVAEAFFKFLKHEEVYRRTYSTKNEMMQSIFSYIDGCYNNDRPHSVNKNITPNEKEKQFAKQKSLLHSQASLRVQQGHTPTITFQT